MAARRDLEAYQGDTFTHEIRMQDSNGNPLNVAGSTFASQVRRRADYTTVEAVFSVDMTNAATGVVVFTLSSVQTAGLLAGRYRYDVHQTTGSTVLTLTYGNFEVRGEVTR